VLDKPMIEEPGSRFNYCSGCSHVLSAIVQQATGTSTLHYAPTNLFEPLGISDVVWETDSRGIANGGWGLKMTPLDLIEECVVPGSDRLSRCRRILRRVRVQLWPAADHGGGRGKSGPGEHPPPGCVSGGGRARGPVELSACWEGDQEAEPVGRLLVWKPYLM